MFVLAVVVAQVRDGLVDTEALFVFSSTVLESVFVGEAAGSFAAKRAWLVSGVVILVGGVEAVVSARGGVADLGRLPSEGDGARTSSTGLFY